VHASEPIRRYTSLAAVGAVVAFLGWRNAAGQGTSWLIAGGSIACAVFGVLLWRRALGLRNAMAGIPTARLASAPQGYVELNGRARRLTEEFSTVRPHFLWQRVTRSKGTPPWVLGPLAGLLHASANREVTEVPFCFSDGDASAVILPEGAEVICKSRQVGRDGDVRTLTESIHSGEALYVLGYLSSIDQVPNLNEEAERIAADLRIDPEGRKRFDTDGDGRWSVPELLKLHETAKKMASERAWEASGQTHVISKPPDGRRYLISTLPIGPMAARFLGYAWLGFALGAAGAASAVAWFATGREFF